MTNVILLSEFENKESAKYKSAIAKCRCGGTYRIRESIYKRGRSSSCGCVKAQSKHGYHKTNLYQRWESMKQRCYYSGHSSYRNYGAIGIRVCFEWHSFIPFKDWAESNGYHEDLELDRINNKEGYYPDNCRWVTHSFNNRNKKTNHLIRYKGETKTITEWAEIYGQKVNTIKGRIKLGWPIEKAFTKPSQTKKHEHKTVRV